MIHLKDFIVLDKVAQGGMGTIYRGLQGNGPAQRLVAIKFVRHRHAKTEMFKKIFKEEVAQIFPLVHANIAQCYSVGEEKGQLYCVMEYIDGLNLKMIQDRVQKKLFQNFAEERLPLPLAIYIIMETAKGLGFAHRFHPPGKNEISLIHRDVSPHNIMVSFDGLIKIIDFGMAKQRDIGEGDEKTATGHLKGKPSYMAPEYIRGKYYDHRLDQYALGIVFWELITGARLFTGNTIIEIIQKIDRNIIPDPREFNPDLPNNARETIARMLNPNPRKRFSSMEEVVKSLMPTFAMNPVGPSDLKNFFHQHMEEDFIQMRDNLRNQITKALVRTSLRRQDDNVVKTQNSEAQNEANKLTFQRGRKAS